MLDELARVLHRGGRLCLAFGDAGFMRSLPFAEDFELHELDAVELALRVSGFTVTAWRSHRECTAGTTPRRLCQSRLKDQLCMRPSR